MLREMRVIDTVAGLIQNIVNTRAYALETLTQAMPITHLLQLCYKLLAVTTKVSYCDANPCFCSVRRVPTLCIPVRAPRGTNKTSCTLARGLT